MEISVIKWAPIEGFPNYRVSNQGQVKSLGNDKTRKEKILKPQPNTMGYHIVTLWKDGKKKPFLIERLVATAFCDNPNNYTEVFHKDGDKLNNKAENLYWGDRSDIDWDKWNPHYDIEALAKFLSEN